MFRPTGHLRRLFLPCGILIACLIILSIALLDGRGLAALQPSHHRYDELPESASLSDNSTQPVGWWTSEDREVRNAYAQYATSTDYFCNALINFSRLRRFGAKHDMVLMYPKTWNDKPETSAERKALKTLADKLPYVKAAPFDVVSTQKGDSTWRDSPTKFQCFKLLDYTRVMAFDSDTLVLNTMDHFFLAPKCSVAVPRAYWLKPSEEDGSIKQQILGSHVMLLEPDQERYDLIMEESKRSGDFDMEILNHLFNSSAMILPHRRLALLTGEFRANDHSRYMAEDEDAEWNGFAELSRAFLVHFSDWPLPKPWKHRSEAQWQASLPACPADESDKPDRPRCADRVAWTSVYEEYDSERSNVCSDF